MQLQPAVGRAAADHFEGDIGVPVIDPILAAAPGDHWKDDDAETIHETGRQKGSAERETAQGAHRLGALVLHLAHALDGILG